MQLNGGTVGHGSQIEIVGPEVVAQRLYDGCLSVQDVLEAHKVPVFQTSYFREGCTELQFGVAADIDFSRSPDTIEIGIPPFEDQIGP